MVKLEDYKYFVGLEWKGCTHKCIGLDYSIRMRTIQLKWYYDKKIISFFFSDFESVIAKHPNGKILSFVFYPKAVYFECKFWISRSAITHVQN